MRFGQLKEYKKYFSSNIYAPNVALKEVLEPFLKNRNWAYLWIWSLKFHTVCFNCMSTFIKPFEGLQRNVKIESIFKINFYRACNFIKKKYSKTGVFLWILQFFRNICFEKYLRTAVSGDFSMWIIKVTAFPTVSTKHYIK